MEHTDRKRRMLDRSFTGVSIMAIVLMAAALVIILAPIFQRGLGAFVFQATVEHRRVQLELFQHGRVSEVAAEYALAQAARRPAYDMLATYEKQLEGLSAAERRKSKAALKDLKKALHELLGPGPDETKPIMLRDRFGQTRWDRAQVKLARLLYVEEYDHSDPTRMGRKVLVPRSRAFQGTALEPFFPYMEQNLQAMLRPRLTCYWRFLTEDSRDAHFFGGIWPEVLGTFYLTLGAMLFAVPMGVLAAIYLVMYARQTRLIGLLRSCISTLAGVPSIVFGLFGLAFFINGLHVSHNKSVLAGSLTLGLLILPTVIRSAEEAIRAVPNMYREAALSLGASTWQAIRTVILPAALPGILTGIVISMGRAAGETAPIIFTAAVSVGKPLSLWQTFTQPTPALPWNIYNLCTEHEAVDEIRHVQYGMVLTLVLLVLLLNLAAIMARARIARRLRG